MQAWPLKRKKQPRRKVILAQELLLPNPQHLPVSTPLLPKKKKGTVFLCKYIWFQFWDRLFFHWTHKEAIFKSHTHSAVGLTVAGLNQESLAPEPHSLFIRVANSHGPPGRERIATEGGTLDPAASVRICPHPSVCWWSEGRAGPDVHPSHCHPGILKWPLLTSFSYELIVVCTHELCPGSWLPLCLIRSRSNAQCSLGEESEAQVMHPLIWDLLSLSPHPHSLHGNSHY